MKKHEVSTNFINENMRQNSKTTEALVEDQIKHIQLESAQYIQSLNAAQHFEDKKIEQLDKLKQTYADIRLNKQLDEHD